ncbi:ABC transporter permease [Paenibacillus flagellatus]|uniref:Protein lplB n=1 Tax=Paenibacillus flagellatus TaxID=2211139 RepID=A0A2V5KC90_9BACL|nr:ABC transporter permease subunit [Paenibacillus flagellatus]PYI56612.1 protein lplB [Paenibacillus flagellatus]
MSISRKPLPHRLWHFRTVYLMLLPALLFYIVFCYVPMYGILIAFKDYKISKGILASPWIGLDMFRTLFALDKFWQVMFNTLYINVLKLIWGFPAPIVLALLLNEVRRRLFKRTVQTIIYLPHFISWVTIASIVTALLSINDGLVNKLIGMLGGEKIDFLTNSDLFRPLLVATNIWKEVGWSTIIFFAAIAGISPELYEAAVMDGAGRWRQVWHITLPGIVPTISILLILSMGGMMTGGFDQVFNLYNPMVYDVGDTIDTYIFRTGIGEGKFSMATAVGLFLNVINFILLFTVNNISRRISGIGIY